MNIPFRKARRLAYGSLALAFVAAATLPALQQAASAAQLTSRSVMMSNSAPSATGVTYNVSFTTATAGNIQGVVVDFCSGTPIIGDNSGCGSGSSGPTGLSTASATVTATSGLNSGTWTASTIQTGNHTLSITNSSATTSVPAGTAVTVTIGGMVNPSTSNTTFYARLLTYATSSAAGSYTSGTPGSYVDYGGAALSTAQTITVTAKVMETLTFCVGGTAITGSSQCSTTSSPAITLGHGGNTALDATATDTANVYSYISTNAASGAVVRMKAGNSCSNGGLSAGNGSTCLIAGVGGTSSTSGGTAIPAGTNAYYGMCVTPGSANTVAVAPYNNSGCTQYGMDNSSATSVTSTYGSPVLNTNSLPVNGETATYKFAATASNTTPAGIYTGTENLIATGTF